MPDADDRLRRELGRIAQPADASSALDAVERRKAHRATVRRVQVAALVVAVLAVTGVGTYALTKTFRFGSGGEQIRRPGMQLAANGRIAFVSNRERGSHIYSIDPGGTALATLWDDGLKEDHPAWSPDGSRLAFIEEDPSGQRWIDTIAPDGTFLISLTEGETVADTGLSWSPDMREVAFVSSHDDKMGLYTVGCCGDYDRQVRLIDDSLDSYASPAWSPDGSTILFVGSTSVPAPCPSSASCSSEASDQALYSIRPDGSGLTRIETSPSNDVQDPDWSPDGTRIAYSSGGRIWVSSPDGSDARAITPDIDPPPNIGLGATDPEWSPDGAQIVFVAVGIDYTDLVVISANGGDLQQLTLDPARNVEPSWQPIPSPSPAPTMPPTPPVNPGPTPSVSPLPASCDASRVFADFDGDGQVDVATVRRADCIEPSPAEDTTWAIDVQWPADPALVAPSLPTTGTWPLPDCEMSFDACRALSAGDVDGNGTAELAIRVDQGASTTTVEMFELPIGERGPLPLEMASEGVAHHPPGQPLQALWGGSVTHEDFITCDTASDGTPLLILTSGFVPSAPTPGPWEVDQLELAIDGTTLTVFGDHSFTSPMTDASPPFPVDGHACFTDGAVGMAT